MAFEFVMLKKPTLWLMQKAYPSVKGWCLKRLARIKSQNAEKFIVEGTIQQLLSSELEKLAGEYDSSSAHQDIAFRSLLRDEKNIEHFVRALIAIFGDYSNLAGSAENALADNYFQLSHESRTLASNRIRRVVTDVYAQINATKEGKEALLQALSKWLAVSALKEQGGNLSEDVLARAENMASELIEVGKRSWKMPRFIAPLIIDLHQKNEENDQQVITPAEIIDRINDGKNIVLFGSGGIGKTTCLLELCSAMIGTKYIPIFVDAAVWARTALGLFDYVAGTNAAKSVGVTSIELAKLAAAGNLVVMLNGWNEVSPPSKLVCRDELIQLSATRKRVCVVLVTRDAADSPSLQDVLKIEVRGLAWKGQSAIIDAELDAASAKALFEILVRNNSLRHAARSPLILRGLIAQARKGAVEDSCSFDLLGASVNEYEEDDQRKIILSATPVEGHQSIYLEALACSLANQLSIDCTRDEALRAFNSASSMLKEQMIIDSQPSASLMLETLVSHHLLQLEDGVVRFAHQRFQEYFCAKRLLRELVTTGVTPVALLDAINLPSWYDSLVMAAEKIRHGDSNASARALLISSAIAIDICLACDLVGVVSFRESDGASLYQEIVNAVNKMKASSLSEVQRLGITCQVASRLDIFSENLFSLLESDDRNIRLDTCRMNGRSITVGQLGVGADKRIASWSSENRVEFVHEIAGDAGNYEFLVGLARNEADSAVRAAAITSLFWNFPASSASMEAWLEAPVDVQTVDGVLSDIVAEVEDGLATDEVKERLKVLVESELHGITRLKIALLTSSKIDESDFEIISESLRKDGYLGDYQQLVECARLNFPEKLQELARRIALQPRHVPSWVGEYLWGSSAEFKALIFEDAWTKIQSSEDATLVEEVIGPLASLKQVDRSVSELLGCLPKGSLRQADDEFDRQRDLLKLLANADGSFLLESVMQRSRGASYDEAVMLVDLVFRRMGNELGSSKPVHKWSPTIDEVHSLIALFNNLKDHADVPQNSLQIRLCCIASDVEPLVFQGLILDTCKLHLDAHSIYRDRIEQWTKKPSSARPNNPQLGNLLASAIERLGAEGLPILLEIVNHPCALDFVPGAISRIVNLPWAAKGERLFRSVSGDIQEGERRRNLGSEFKQPDESFQSMTDQVANVLGQKLEEQITLNLEKKEAGSVRGTSASVHGINRLATIVANIPSELAIKSVLQTISSGLMELYGAVNVLRGLIRQGMILNDPASVTRLEALYEKVASEKWHDQSTSHAMAELSEILVCAIVPEVRVKTIEYYLNQWTRFSHINEVVRCLGATRVEVSWSAVLFYGKELASKGQVSEELFPALISTFTKNHFDEFLALIADGVIFSWRLNAWTLERLSPEIAVVFSGDAVKVEKFIAACRSNGSDSAVLLCGEVLSHIKNGADSERLFLLDALDAGKAINQDSPALRQLKNMFTIKVDNSSFNTAPRANNELRKELYLRAKSGGPIADTCKRLLASLECKRRMYGRPTDEPRHPSREDGLAWTSVL